MLTVEVTIKRVKDDGAVTLIQSRGTATSSLLWVPDPDMWVVDNGVVLTGFEYLPRFRPFSDLLKHRD